MKDNSILNLNKNNTDDNFTNIFSFAVNALRSIRASSVYYRSYSNWYSLLKLLFLLVFRADDDRT